MMENEAAAVTPDVQSDTVSDVAEVTAAESGVAEATIGDGVDSGASGALFELPDEYKEKAWASKIKSQEDLYKQIDNLNSLVGKKTIAPIDYSTATPEEIAQYHASLAPDDVSKYDFGEGADPEFSKQVAGIFKELGISEYQARELAPRVNEIAAKIVEQNEASSRSEEAYNSMLSESFGSEAGSVLKAVDTALVKHANEDDQKAFDGMSNEMRMAVNRTVHNMLKEYGASERGVGEGRAGSAVGVTDYAAQRSQLRKELRSLENSGQIYTADDRQKFIDKIQETFRKEGKI
jgi:hypothetical protein